MKSTIPSQTGPSAKQRRAKAGTAALILLSALALLTLANYKTAIREDPVNPAGIDMDESRFTEVRALLPARGTIGYLSDTSATAENTRDYYLTQYYLTPLVVAPDPNHELVVANFASPAALGPEAAANGLTVERQFPNGVALLRKRPE